MPKEQYTISIEDIYALVTQLEEAIEKIDDSELKKYFIFLCETIFLPIEDSIANIKKRGIYKAFLIGLDNFDIIRQIIVGLRQSSIISDQTSCLIEIEKIFKTDGQQIIFKFTDNIDYLNSNKILLKRIFNKYMPDIDFDENQRTTLIISDNIIDFLENPDVDIRLVLGIEGLVNTIKINYCYPPDESVYTNINKLVILTEKYLKQHLRGHESENHLDHTVISQSSYSSNFVELFKRTNGYNFFILNSENDFLINIYIACIKRYLEYFQIDHESYKPLLNAFISSIFYMTDTKYITERYITEHPDIKQILPIDIFTTTLEYRHLPSTIVIALSILIKIIMHKRIEIVTDLAKLSEKIEQMETYLLNTREIVNNDTKNIMSSFDTLKKSIEDIKVNQKQLADNREQFFEKYKNCLILLSSFIKTYCNEKENIIVEANDDFTKNELCYLRKDKFLLLFDKHDKSKKELIEYIDNRIKWLYSILPYLKENIQISNLNNMIAEINNFIVDLKEKTIKQNIEYALTILGEIIALNIINFMSKTT